MQIKPPRRHHLSATEKTRILQACERSGLTHAAFAAKQGIGLSTLYQWRRQSGRRDSNRHTDLIEVPNLLPNGPALAPYRLHLPGGRMLEVARGFDASELRVLAQLLQSL